MVVNGLLTLALSAIAVEVALRIPLIAPARQAASTGQRALRTVQRRASDEHKERAMRGYAVRMVAATARAALGIALLAAVVLAVVFAASWFVPRFDDFLVGPLGLALSLTAATLYALARRRLV